MTLRRTRARAALEKGLEEIFIEDADSVEGTWIDWTTVPTGVQQKSRGPDVIRFRVVYPEVPVRAAFGGSWFDAAFDQRLAALALYGHGDAVDDFLQDLVGLFGLPQG